MKKIYVWVFFALFSINASALGGYETLSGDSKIAADRIKKSLDITEEDTFRIFEGFVKEQMNTKNWHYNTFDNKSLKSSRVEGAGNKFVSMNIVTDNRFVNLIFIKFAAEKQVLVQSMETLSRPSQIVLDRHNALKKDSDFTVDTDNAEFSVFTKNGMTKKIKILVNSGVGGIQYVDLYTFDLKD